MAKNRKKVELKAVDEESADQSSRFIRLQENGVEELDDKQIPKIGHESGSVSRLESATRIELKTRSNEPDMDDLIERETEPIEDEWETNDSSQKKLPWVWLVVVSGLFCAGIIWSLVQIKDSETRQDSLEVQAKSVLDEEAQEELAATTMVDTIEKVVRDFHASSSIDELLKHVRHPERVRPLMEDYYSRHPLVPAQVESFESLLPLTMEDNGDFWIINANLESIGALQVLVEVESNEVAKVDWESFVPYQPIDWDRFAVERPSGYFGEFRVYFKPDHTYSHEFADSNRYASYKLETTGSDEYVNGYVLRDSELFKKMEYLFSRANDSQMPVILTLHIPENLLSRRGVLIEDLVAPRWIYLESPEVDSQ